MIFHHFASFFPWKSHFSQWFPHGENPRAFSQVYVGGLDLAVRDTDLLKAFDRYSSVNSAKAGGTFGGFLVVFCVFFSGF